MRAGSGTLLIQAEEKVGRPSWGVRLAAATRLQIALLGTEVAVGSPDLARIGLIGLALALQTVVLFSPGHFRPAGTALYGVLVPLGTGGSLAAALLATLSLKRLLNLHARQMLAASAFLSLSILAVVGVWRGTSGIYAMAHQPPYNNDGAVMDLYAAQRVLHGHDPYLKTNIVIALAGINAPCITTTPVMDGQFRGARAYPSEAAVEQVCLNVLRHRTRPGVPIPPEFESKYNYPAGSMLVILPFVWAGLHDMRFLYILAIMAMGAFVWFRMPRSLRVLVPFLMLANVPLVMLTIGGQPDPLYGVFLMVGFAEWPRPWLSPLTLGIAVAIKQLAWFFLPFYVVLMIRRFGWREALRRSGLVVLVFLATNGPFIAQSPGAYLASVSGPMSDPLFPLGIGVIALFVSNVLPMIPKVAFSLAEIVCWVTGAGLFARWRALTPASAVILAALPLFVAWRSLVNYFYLVPLLALAVALADRRPRPDVLAPAVSFSETQP